MGPVTRGERIFLVAVAVLAVWVGFWGYLIPRHVEKALPFFVPPLHARFIGAVYVAGAVAMIGAYFARGWGEIRILMPLVAIWTGLIFVVSLFYLEEFDFSLPKVHIWFAAYVIYPAVAAWLGWKHRNEPAPPGGSIPEATKRAYLIQGVAIISLALALLILPGVMVDAWPWPITRLLSQIYSAPFLALGVTSILMARSHTWPEIRIPAAAIATFAALALLASLIHLDLFSAGDAAAWLWFVGLAAVVALFASAVSRERAAARTPGLAA